MDASACSASSPVLRAAAGVHADETTDVLRRSRNILQLRRQACSSARPSPLLFLEDVFTRMHSTTEFTKNVLLGCLDCLYVTTTDSAHQSWCLSFLCYPIKGCGFCWDVCVHEGNSVWSPSQLGTSCSHCRWSGGSCGAGAVWVLETRVQVDTAFPHRAELWLSLG